jgi:hypothetical protein
LPALQAVFFRQQAIKAACHIKKFQILKFKNRAKLLSMLLYRAGICKYLEIKKEVCHFAA